MYPYATLNLSKNNDFCFCVVLVVSGFCVMTFCCIHVMFDDLPFYSLSGSQLFKHGLLEQLVFLLSNTCMIQVLAESLELDSCLIQVSG